MNKTATRIYRGFDLKKVTWGYRDIFRNAIDQLYAEKLLGEENNASTEIFFSLLKKTDNNHCFDHVLKNFIQSLNIQNNWIMRNPALFSNWADLGAKLAEEKTYLGLSYFEIWGKGGFGSTPEEVAYVLTKMRFLLDIDVDFSYYFVKSYQSLARHLKYQEIDIFIEYALQLYSRSPKSSYSFLQLRTKTSKEYLKFISRESRLQDNLERLQLFARAITGESITILPINQLDSDNLIIRGTKLACFQRQFFFPEKSTFFSTRQKNRDFYLLLTIITGMAYSGQSFIRLHGDKNASCSLAYLAGQQLPCRELLNNLVNYIEMLRILKNTRDIFPGFWKKAKVVINSELSHNTQIHSSENLTRIILQHLLHPRRTFGGFTSILPQLDCMAGDSSSFQETVKIASETLACSEQKEIIEKCCAYGPPPLTFFPDFMFEATIASTPGNKLMINLKKKNPPLPENMGKDDDRQLPIQQQADQKGAKPGEDKNQPEGPMVGFFYDEWNEPEKDYFENWCCLNEKTPGMIRKTVLHAEFQQYSRQVKQLFERLKPDLTRKEKYLQNGDNINIDHLVDYLSLRKAKIYKEENFYDKPYVKQRDLAVAILVDISGSTSERVLDNYKIIELERNSAFILAEGLAELGDEFAIFGFTGTGRENAEFYIYKDFWQEWDEQNQKRLLSAEARSSTRMGVALRHTGFKISQLTRKKKLIIIITDGKPMDSGYDPYNGYAQHDVRMANRENAKQGIDCFCISTEENRVDDLELMFPGNHYVLIKSMVELPRVLTQLYLKITK